MANKKRLIWDEDAKRHLIALAVGHHSETLHIDMILNAILHHAPTVDAVPVVRCKDCKHRRRYVFPFSDQIYTKCKIWGGIPRPDDFCSYGERRSDGGENNE